MNKLILLLLVALLPGCGWFQQKPQDPVEIQRRVQPIPVFHPALPEAVTWQEVEWKVLTPETMQEYLDDYDNGDVRAMVFYGLTPEGYRALSENVADLQRFIRQQRALVQYYRENLVEIVIEEGPIVVPSTVPTTTAPPATSSGVVSAP
jgi:hypothetical protein